MNDLNILDNEKALAILRSASDSLNAIGMNCVITPLSLPQGMSINLYVGSTLQAAVAANVATRLGGDIAQSVDMHKQFESEVNYALSDEMASAS